MIDVAGFFEIDDIKFAQIYWNKVSLLFSAKLLYSIYALEKFKMYIISAGNVCTRNFIVDISLKF